MPADFLTLVRRDHADLQLELTQLLDPETTDTELRMALDGVRLGLTAHAEAEDIVLGALEAIPTLAPLIRAAREAHLAQETALSTLIGARPQTTRWRDRASHLRDLVATHARHEERHLVPALRAHAGDYAGLAGRFATERLRQLALLQPSAPVVLPLFAC